MSRTSGEGEFIVPLWRLGDKYIISAGLVGETESVKCFISRHKNDVVVVAISVIALCLSVSVSLPLLCLCMSVCLSLSVCLSVCLSVSLLVLLVKPRTKNVLHQDIKTTWL